VAWARRRIVIALSASAAVIAVASPARAADEDLEPIRLAYHASDGCPEEEAFVERVRARTARARVAWPGEAARTFEVTLDAGPPASGSVTVLAADRWGQTRHVSADACDDLADALALVVALSVDPHAETAPSLTPRVASSTAASVPPPSAPLLAPPPPPVVTVAPVSRESPPPSTDTTLAGHFFAGADFAISGGVAPEALVGGSPFVGWQARLSPVLEPSIRLALVRASSDIQGPPSAAFVWTAGRLDGCPVAFGDAIRLRGCARVEAGVVTVAAGDIPLAETRVRPWFALGPLGRVEVPVVGPLFFDAEVALTVRVTNDRFYFAPDTTLYRVPVIATSEACGIGAHFL
jgi:hypothetical protein